MVARAASAPATRPVAPRLLIGAAVGVLLLVGVAGGLWRAGALPGPASDAAASHGALMIGGWLASVIAIERAVALKTVAARAAPVLSIAGGLAMAAGLASLAPPLLLSASTAFVLAHAQLWQRQRAGHTAVLGLAALTGWAGNLAWWWQGPGSGHGQDGVVSAWFAFLVLTIAAERLEMTRLLRRPRWAAPLFGGATAALLLAVASALAGWARAPLAFGGALLALAAWLATQDIARVTIRQPGLPRYMAVALWAGYGWLAVGGVAWIATALGAPWRDAALHAIGIGFVLGMVMAHAPVILPAVAGLRLAFGPAFYAPLALLHLSLAWRLIADLRSGAALNAAALVAMALTLALAVHRARRRGP